MANEMKDAYYFSHDSNARNDHRIMKLRMDLGMEGYGIYWAIIEMLREQANYTLPIDSIELISYEIRSDSINVEKVINEYNLFIPSISQFILMHLIYFKYLPFIPIYFHLPPIINSNE